MKLKEKENKTVKFKDLKGGDLFRFSDIVFIKLLGPITTYNNHVVSAVACCDGSTVLDVSLGLNENTLVTPVNGSFVEE